MAHETREDGDAVVVEPLFRLPPMSDAPKEPRRPILTRREQAVLAFILALLIVGGIVRKVRTEWHTEGPLPVRQS
jgi:hypothetical protein